MKLNRAKLASILLAVLIIGAIIFFVSQKAGESEILVLCGGSMRVPMEEIIRNYSVVSDDSIMLTVGGSGDLCAQIKYTRKGDIYVCHDPFMPWAEKQGLIETWSTVAYLEPVIAVKKGNPRKIRELKDLAQPGIRLGVGDPRYSTCGVIVDQMIKQMGYEDALRKNIKMTSKTHHKIATDLALGTLDAAIIWNAVAHNYPDKLDMMPIGEQYVDAITSATFGVTDLKHIKVTIGIIKYARNKDNVRKFWEYATTAAKPVFKQSGFTPVEE